MVVVLDELRIGLDATLFRPRDGALLESELLVLTLRSVVQLGLLSWLSELVHLVGPVLLACSGGEGVELSCLQVFELHSVEVGVIHHGTLTDCGTDWSQ